MKDIPQAARISRGQCADKGTQHEQPRDSPHLLPEKTVIKENCVFVFTLPNKQKVEVDGKLLVSRPEDRIKKKLPRW
ncbi:ribonuclease P protein subunit [archaeon]|nr:ribonuclease P protein subunit [archaeon]